MSNDAAIGLVGGAILSKLLNISTWLDVVVLCIGIIAGHALSHLMKKRVP